jgi:transposase
LDEAKITKGRPLYVTLTPGQRRDSNNFLRVARGRGMKPVIHSKPERKKNHRLDRALYRQRYLVEVCLHWLRRFRAIATRYEKTSRNYLALVQLACAWLCLS